MTLEAAVSAFEAIERRCPNRADHTPVPLDVPVLTYIRTMSKTHRRVTCKGCGLPVIWRRRLSRYRLSSEGK